MADTGKSSSAEASAAPQEKLNVDRCSLFVGQVHRPYILALGRLAPQKAFDILIRAYALVAAAAAKHSASGIEHLEEKGSAALPSRRAGANS